MTHDDRAVLFDADGVLQHPRPGWVDRLAERARGVFPAEVFEAEAEALEGRRWFSDVLAELLERRGSDARVEELMALWEDIEVDADAWAVVADVRALGIHTALATNQHDHRMRFMRTDLGYDGQTDGAYYSCELGVRKPDPAYFRAVLDDLGLPANHVAFVDDSRSNVDAAAEVGLIALLHDPASGAGALRSRLAAHLPGLS